MSAVADRPAVLDRTQAQRLEALELANEIRFARARLKRQVANGETTVAAVLADPPDWCHSMKVMHLLDASPGWGPARVAKAMRRVQISYGKTVGGLTAMRRELLVAYLEGAAR